MCAVKKATQTGKAGGSWEKITSFFRGVWAELKKVHWPSRSELITYTLVVVAAVAVVSVMIGVVDFALGKALEQVLK